FGPDAVSFTGFNRAGTLYFRKVYSDVDQYIATLDPATGEISSAPAPIPLPGSGRNLLPRFSPDGRKIAYYRLQPIETIREVKIYPFDSQMEQPVRSRAIMAGGPICWNHDGQSILMNTMAGNGNTRQETQVQLDLKTGDETILFPNAPNFDMTSCSED